MFSLDMRRNIRSSSGNLVTIRTVIKEISYYAVTAVTAVTAYIGVGIASSDPEFD